MPACSDLRPISEAPSQAYLSNTIQVADLLVWLLSQTGPAAVTVSSFSISEEFLRRIFFIRREGLVSSLKILLDFKATNKTLKLWPFIAQTVEGCFLSDNHSKVLLVENDSHAVVVAMSQNLTRGNRYESAFISTDPEVFISMKRQLDDIISNKSIKFHDVFRRKTQSD